MKALARFVGTGFSRRSRGLDPGLAAVVAGVALTVAGVCEAVVSAASAATLDGVLTGRSSTWDPSAGVDGSSGDAFLSWTLYRKGVPAALFRINSDPSLQLNRRGVGWAWSLDVASQTAGYQQDRGGNSDVRFYDWATELRSNPGVAVNTSRWEYEPAVSGQRLVFARLNRAAAPDVRRIILVQPGHEPVDRARQVQGIRGDRDTRGAADQRRLGDVDVDGRPLSAVERSPLPDLHRQEPPNQPSRRPA